MAARGQTGVEARCGAVRGREAFLLMSLARAESAWAFDVTSVSRELIEGHAHSTVKGLSSSSGGGGGDGGVPVR